MCYDPRSLQEDGGRDSIIEREEGKVCLTRKLTIADLLQSSGLDAAETG